MTPTPYQAALALTLEFEGGYYDGSEARDPNPTNYGVIQSTYDEYRTARGLARRPVKQITTAEVEDIYRDFWFGAYCDEWARTAPLTAMTVFDMAINAGPKRGVKMIQRATGAVDDGKVGPKTRAAVAAMLAQAGDRGLAERVCWARLRYYRDLATRARYRPNLLSWVTRVVVLYERALR